MQVTSVKKMGGGPPEVSTVDSKNLSSFIKVLLLLL